jgi:hypothetical protein
MESHPSQNRKRNSISVCFIFQENSDLSLLIPGTGSDVESQNAASHPAFGSYQRWTGERQP